MTATLPRVTLEPPTGFIYDKRSEGWELLEEGPQVEGTPTLDFLGFLREGEAYVNGETVLARAAEMDGIDSGQHHLERMLQQADRIPVELRPFYLVAPGTLWRYPDGSLYVPCLRWRGGKWVLGFGCVDAAAGLGTVGWSAFASSLGSWDFGAMELLFPLAAWVPWVRFRAPAPSTPLFRRNLSRDSSGQGCCVLRSLPRPACGLLCLGTVLNTKRDGYSPFHPK